MIFFRKKPCEVCGLPTGIKHRWCEICRKIIASNIRMILQKEDDVTLEGTREQKAASRFEHDIHYEELHKNIK